jgi:hypothetical protein
VHPALQRGGEREQRDAGDGDGNREPEAGAPVRVAVGARRAERRDDQQRFRFLQRVGVA